MLKSMMPAMMMAIVLAIAIPMACSNDGTPAPEATEVVTDMVNPCSEGLDVYSDTATFTCRVARIEVTESGCMEIYGYDIMWNYGDSIHEPDTVLVYVLSPEEEIEFMNDQLIQQPWENTPRVNFGGNSITTLLQGKFLDHLMCDSVDVEMIFFATRNPYKNYSFINLIANDLRLREQYDEVYQY